MPTQNVIGTVINGHKVGGAIYGENPSATVNTGGVRNHNSLTGRDADDQHPISAITGLQDDLDMKVEADELAPVAFTGDAEDLTWPQPLILYCGTASEVV